MDYFYFHPFSRQYIFPENFANYPKLLSIYQPYTKATSLLWQFWQYSAFFRNQFQVLCLDKELPIEEIMAHVSKDAVMAFNKGKFGPERKTTILGTHQTDGDFFIKYANTQIARENVNNEGIILNQLNHLDFIPSLLLHINHPSYSLIKTNVLEGTRLSKKSLDVEITTILLLLSELQVKCRKDYSVKELKCCFSHGDFCPWNMLTHNGKLKVFDWEMAGQYPLGYDLFTYIFQTEFLLKRYTENSSLLIKNSFYIKKYFNAFNEPNWKRYLLAFASLKYGFEIEKNNKRLIGPYKRLKEYAAQI